MDGQPKPWAWGTRAAVFGALLLVAIAAAGDLSAQPTPPPTPGGDCCSPHGGPSCDLPSCAECACTVVLDDLCCTTQWDAVCAGYATGDTCGASCGCETPTPLPPPTPGGDCCNDHASPRCDDSVCSACVCGIDPVCCSGQRWDATCAAIARNLDECATDCPCDPDPTQPPGPTPTAGPCCEARDLIGGCDQADCEACVCGVDEVCCSDTWDGNCVSIASDECAVACMCSDLGDCCQDHDGPGCNVSACQDCVIALDPPCADQWDTDCAGEAQVECALDCPCGDCCAAQDQPGCGEKTCQSCVCAADPNCCGDVWDGICADRAATDCSLDCPCGDCCDAQDVPGCGAKGCQACVCAFDANCCGDVWDGICADRAATECALRCPCETTSDCCEARVGEAGCSEAACESCVCDLDPFCCDEFWDEDCAQALARSPECGAVCACDGGGSCVGDCDGDRNVSVANLITGVNISLGRAPLSACAIFDSNGNGAVSVAELIQGVRNALEGCA